MNPSNLDRRRLLVALSLAPCAAPAPAATDAAAWAALQAGGHVALLRHALTTPGVGDPPGFRAGDCATQRNLSDEGRAQARRLGQAFAARGVTVERVLSSPWCRCIDTAQLAFGRAEVADEFGNLYTHPERRAAQLPRMRERVSGWRGRGNLVLVSHGATVQALTGVYLGMGELLIVRPTGPDRWTDVGRIALA
jgi:broad specificity phosphatase PhoE